MKNQKDNYYFQSFVSLFDYTCKAADYLENILKEFNKEISTEERVEIHAIEHSADLALHDCLEKLAKEFITPIEREDIINIIKLIDDATDSVEDIAVYMYIHKVKKVIPAYLDFIKVVKDICEAQKQVLLEFPNFKKSKTIKDLILKVLSIEEKGDEIYLTNVRELYVNENDALKIHVIEDLLYRFENCCDSIEELAQAVDAAIMKNS